MMDETAESPLSAKKDRKDKKKKKHHRREGETEEDAAERRERRREKKQKKKSKRGSRTPSPSGALTGSEIRGEPIGQFAGDKSSSWTANAFVPSEADRIVSDLNFLQSEKTVKEGQKLSKRNEGEPAKKDLSSDEIASMASASGGQAAEELSIEETNKLRAALGLKPLTASGTDGTKAKAKKEDVHAPAENIQEKKNAEKVRERLQVVKEKQKLEKGLRTIKGLGEADDDEDISSWVQKSRRLEEERRQAEIRARILQEMDEEAEESDRRMKEARANYSSRDLQGLVVEHSFDTFEKATSRELVLTLKDKGILEDGADEDVLVSGVLEEEAKLQKNLLNRRQANKPRYNPYEDAAEDPLKPVQLLKQYDEVLEGPRKEKFVLDTGGMASGGMRQDTNLPPGAVNVSLVQAHALLNNSSMAVAKDYLNDEEMAARFKKVRRKRPAGTSNGTRRRTGALDDVENSDEKKPLIKQELGGFGSSADDPEDDIELQLALTRARRLRLQERSEVVKEEEPWQDLKPNPVEIQPSIPGYSKLFLDETSEFCRTVGISDSYQSGSSSRPGSSRTGGDASKGMVAFDKVPTEPMDIDEPDERRSRPGSTRSRASNKESKSHKESNVGGWSEVQFEAEPANLDDDEKDNRGGSRRENSQNGDDIPVSRSILDDEPTVERGVGAALQLAMKKGLLEQTAEEQEKKRLKNVGLGKKSSIPEQTYTVEDKIIDDDKRGRQERGGYGPLTSFKEKSGYKPGFKLEYHDASGRGLDAKGAFRELSHKFHGKGSGKMKTEKREKKLLEEKLLMEMSSVDTPLGTVKRMQAKQQELQTPYLLLSGASAKAAASQVPPPLSKKS